MTGTTTTTLTIKLPPFFKFKIVKEKSCKKFNKYIPLDRELFNVETLSDDMKLIGMDSEHE